MAEFASNTPVSRPVSGLGWEPDADFNGLMWSNKWGLMFADGGDALVEPIVLPTQHNQEF